MTLTIPVPEGLTPASFDVTAQLPANVARGQLDVESEGRLLARIDLPPNSDLVPLSIPLAGATVEQDAAVVSLRAGLTAIDNICPEDWTSRSVQLRDGVIRYTGIPAEPTAIADFLPPVLEQLHLYLPETTSAAESTVALDLAAAITSRYSGRRVGVDVRELPVNGIPPAAESPFTRQIVIRESGETGAELGAVPGGPPALYLRGDANSLLDQGRLVVSVLSGFAVTGDTAVAPFTIAQRLSADSATLSELGIGNLETSSLGTASVSVFLDQTRLGRPATDLQLDLKGSYTPLPDSEGGSISVSAGDTVLDTWAAEPGGIIDRRITIPDSALQRVTDLSVSLRTTGVQQACGLQRPVTIGVSGESRITSSIADPPVPGGFESLPQTLIPQVNVAATGSSLIDTARAVDVVAGLQTLSAVPLDPTWVTVDEALASSTPAIVVAADGNVPDQLQLPLVRTEDRRFEVTNVDGESTTLTFGTEVDFASLQVVRDKGRTVLVATSTDAPEELDRTLMWLGAEPERWSNLYGSVLFTAPDRDPIVLADPRGEDGVAQTSAGQDSRVLGVAATSGALLAVGAVGALGWFLVRRRRSRSTR